LVAHDAQGIEKNDDAVGNKVIVFCEFRNATYVAPLYRDGIRLRAGYHQWDTSTSIKNSASRQKRIDAFQAKPGSAS